jgi:hypothetical protein
MRINLIYTYKKSRVILSAIFTKLIHFHQHNVQTCYIEYRPKQLKDMEMALLNLIYAIKERMDFTTPGSTYITNT